MRNDVSFKEALVDTIRYYGDDTSRRSLCFFMHEDGRRCAIGRYIRPEKEGFFQEMDRLHNSNIEAAVHAYQKMTFVSGRTLTENDAIRELLHITDATISDLMLLEILHDEDNNWDENGLSEFGKETVKHFRSDLVEVVHTSLEDGIIA